MGCGVGVTLRSFARRLPTADLNAITLVPWQLEQGRELNQSCPEDRRITLTLGDYEHTTQPTASFNAVYAKAVVTLVVEQIRAPSGGASSPAPGRPHRSRRRIPRARQTTRPAKSHLPQALRMLGDRQPGRSRPVHLRTRAPRLQQHCCRANTTCVTPSVLHVPWVTLKFLFTAVLFGRRRMTRARWNNIFAPMLLPFVGFPFGPEAYYIIGATRT